MKAPETIKLDPAVKQLSEPVRVDGDLIFVSGDAQTFALERSSLAIRWSAPGWLCHSLPGLVSTWKSGVGISGHAAADGHVLWRVPGRGRRHAVWDGRVVTFTSTSLEVRSGSTGDVTGEVALPWAIEPHARICGDLALAAPSNLEPPRSPRVCAVDLRTQSIRWDRVLFERPADEEGPLSMAAGEWSGPQQFYYNDRDTLHACSTEDGSVRWRAALDLKARWPVVAGSTVLLWTGDHLIAREELTGDVIFDVKHDALAGAAYPRLGLQHGRRVVLLFSGQLAVIDLTDGALINLYTKRTTLAGAVMIGERLVVPCGDGAIRVFDQSIWEPTAPRKPQGPRKPPPPRPFTTDRLTAEVLGGGADEPLVFDSRPPITIDGVGGFLAPAAADGHVLVAGEAQGLYSLAPETYSLRWQVPEFKGTPRIHAGFALQQTLVDLARYDVSGLRLADGTKAWTTECDGACCISADFIVTSVAKPGELRLFDPHRGEVVLAFPLPLPNLEGVSDKIALLEDRRGTFAAVDLRDGRELWTQRIEGTVRGLRGDVCVVGSHDRYDGYSLRTGEPLWRWQTSDQTFPFIEGDLWWFPSVMEPRIDILDTRTGEATSLRYKRGSSARIDARFEDYVVSPAAKGVYFYHPSRPAQLLPVRNASRLGRGKQVFDDLVFSEGGRLRPFRRVR
jgi:outer membrane protein assembly factor BamB